MSTVIQGYDGNHNPLDDIRFVADDEPADFLLDADGNEVRAGDWVEILSGNSHSDWVGAIVQVTHASRGIVYGDNSGPHQMREKAWSPTNSCNSLSIIKDRRVSTGTSPLTTRKANLTEEDALLIELRASLLDLAHIDEREANLAGERLKVQRSIRNAKARLDMLDLSGLA